MKKTQTLSLLCLLLFIASPSFAACTLDFPGGTSINFGDYNPFSTTANTQALAFVSNCADTPLIADRTITISSGLNASHPNRKMNNASELLNYNLYAAPGYSDIWGDGTSGTVTVIASETNGENHTINAAISIQQDVNSGGIVYSDTPLIAIGGGTPEALSIQATVPNTCTFGDATLNFGEYNPLGAHQSAPLQASTSIHVNCTKGAVGTITVGMEEGQHYSAGKRRLQGSPTADYLNYDLYLPSSNAPNAACSYSTVWKTTPGSLLDLSSSPPDMNGSTYNVCGQIDAGQVKAPGTYHDSIVMVLSY